MCVRVCVFVSERILIGRIVGMYILPRHHLCMFESEVKLFSHFVHVEKACYC